MRIETNGYFPTILPIARLSLFITYKVQLA